MLSLVAILALSYLLGSVPWSLVAGRLMGVDLRQHGSGNAGATNAWRVLGKGPGTAVFLADFLKGLLPVVLVARLRLPGGLPGWLGADADAWVMVLAGAAAMLGHVYTATGLFFFGSWKGGKGVATGAGMLVGLVPLAIGVAVAVFAAVLAATRYVSVASIVCTATIPVTVLVQQAVTGTRVPGPVLGFVLLVPLFILYTHRANVRRLLAGTEAKVNAPAGPIDRG